jgi:hypothetical protein
VATGETHAGAWSPPNSISKLEVPFPLLGPAKRAGPLPPGSLHQNSYRLYLPVIFQDASEPVGPNRLGQPHGGSVPRHPRAMDVEGIIAETPWLLQGAALWVLSGLVSGRTQSNGMNLPITPFSRNLVRLFFSILGITLACVEEAHLFGGRPVHAAFDRYARFPEGLEIGAPVLSSRLLVDAEN